MERTENRVFADDPEMITILSDVATEKEAMEIWLVVANNSVNYLNENRDQYLASIETKEKWLREHWGGGE